MDESEGLENERWTALLGLGWRGLLYDVPDKDFPTRFLSTENLVRLERIREELGISPVDVMQLCIDAAPSGTEKAPAPREIEKDAAWLSEEVLPRFKRILGYMSEPLTVRNLEQRAAVNRWPRQPRASPSKSEPGGNDPALALEGIREALRHPQPLNANPSLPKSPGKIPRAFVLRRFSLVFPPRLRQVIATLTEVVSALKESGPALAAPREREHNEAESFFLENWEARTLRLRRILATLEARAAAAVRRLRGEEDRIGSGEPTQIWDQLREREARATVRLSKWKHVLTDERRLRAEHGQGLFFVIFGSVIGPDAYERRVARLETSVRPT